MSTVETDSLHAVLTSVEQSARGGRENKSCEHGHYRCATQAAAMGMLPCTFGGLMTDTHGSHLCVCAWVEEQDELAQTANSGQSTHKCLVLKK